MIFLNVMFRVIGWGCMVFLVGVCTVLRCHGQDVVGHMDAVEHWYKGSVVLDRAPESKGYILYNDSLCLFKFKATLEAEAEGLVPRHIVSMDFYDEQQEKLRQFRSFEGLEGSGGGLFEILLASDNFILLSQIPMMEQVVRTQGGGGVMMPNGAGGMTPTGSTTNTSVYYEQFEYLYLATADDGLQLVLKVSRYLVNEKFQPIRGAAKPGLKENVVKKFMDPHWDEVKSYLKAHHLKLKDRDGLISVFTYYNEAF